jgi:hypothetical protein
MQNFDKKFIFLLNVQITNELVTIFRLSKYNSMVNMCNNISITLRNKIIPTNEEVKILENLSQKIGLLYNYDKRTSGLIMYDYFVGEVWRDMGPLFLSYRKNLKLTPND